MRFHASPVFLINEEAIEQDETKTGAWVKMKVGESFNILWKMTSDASPSITIDCDVTPFDPDTYVNTVHDPNSTTYTNYRRITLGSGLTTQDALQHIDTPAEMLYPFVAARLVVTEANVGAITTFSGLFCTNVVG